MELGSLLIVIFIFFLTGWFILRPFFVIDKKEGRAGTTVRDALEAEKERILQAIEEIDLEFDLKKISSAEFDRNRAALMAEAAGVIKELDKYQKSSPKTKVKQAEPVREEDDLEKMIAERRKELKSAQSQKCPHCGNVIEKGSQFCSHCGGAL